MRALEFITGHVIYNPAYTYKFQLKSTHLFFWLFFCSEKYMNTEFFKNGSRILTRKTDEVTMKLDVPFSDVCSLEFKRRIVHRFQSHVTVLVLIM